MKITRFVLGALFGMCLEYYFRVDKLIYPLLISGVIFIIFICDVFNDYLLTERYEILEELDGFHLPVYHILKTTYIGRFSLVAQIYGVDGGLDPFTDYKDAEDYLKILNEMKV